MSLWKKVYEKIKKPTEWIEIPIPKHLMPKGKRDKREEEE